MREQRVRGGKVGLVLGAGVLVLGALANIVLALAGHGGSIVLGLEMLGGALAAMSVTALIRAFITGCTDPA